MARARGTGEYGLARSLITRYSLLALASGMLLLLVFVGIGIWRDDIVMWAILGAYQLFSAPSNITAGCCTTRPTTGVWLLNRSPAI